MELDPIAVAAGVKLLALDTVGSTNARARLAALQGESGPLWVTAVAQTAGRGRLDRSWVSPAGNLYASLLLSDPSPIDRAAELAFVAALAVRDAVVAEAPALASQLRFKWPNDVLLGGAKCAGILIEGERGAGEAARVVVGIGVNCASHPATSADRPATDLAEHGAPITPQALFRSLSAAMVRRTALWDRGAGIAAIRTDWLATAHPIGTAIVVRNGGAERRGRFAGLDPTGRLLLETPGGGIERVSAGDVFAVDPSDERA